MSGFHLCNSVKYAQVNQCAILTWNGLWCFSIASDPTYSSFWFCQCSPWSIPRRRRWTCGSSKSKPSRSSKKEKIKRKDKRIKTRAHHKSIGPIYNLDIQSTRMKQTSMMQIWMIWTPLILVSSKSWIWSRRTLPSTILAYRAILVPCEKLSIFCRFLSCSNSCLQLYTHFGRGRNSFSWKWRVPSLSLTWSKLFVSLFLWLFGLDDKSLNGGPYIILQNWLLI